jgi:chromosome partitioning protein
MYTISIVNQKGGVGKTTLTVGLATYLQHFGYRVLVIDLDSQQNATSWMLGRHLKPNEASIYDSLITKKRRAEGNEDWPLSDLIETSKKVGVDFVPANVDLSSAQAELANKPLLLRDRLEELEESLGDGTRPDGASDGRYDFCLVDCPPSLGTLVTIALMASQGVIVPIKADAFSMDGLRQLIMTARETKRLNQDLEILGLVLNNLDVRFGATNDGVETIRDHYDQRLFETRIPTRARIFEAASYGLDLYEHAGGNDAQKIFSDFTREVVDRADVGPPRTESQADGARSEVNTPA